MWIYDLAFCCEFGKMSQIHVFRWSAQIITILHTGVFRNLLQYYMGGGGLPELLQYYNGARGVSRDPKFVLRNIWTAPYILKDLFQIIILLAAPLVLLISSNNFFR